MTVNESLLIEGDYTELKMSVHLHGASNVILKFEPGTLDGPFQWGFITIEEFRSYLKMLLRFDEKLSV